MRMVSFMEPYPQCRILKRLRLKTVIAVVQLVLPFNLMIFLL